MLSQKTQYGVRAVFELAKRMDREAVSTAELAEAQAIPARFLEVILSQLRQARIVESRRGVQGGYRLALDPDKITVGSVIRFFNGPIAPVKCVAKTIKSDCPLRGTCAFTGLWGRAREALSQVYDTTTFRNLVEEQMTKRDNYSPSFEI